MSISDAKWLFFDLGSTLLNESLCDEMIISESLRGTDISADKFKDKMRCFASQNKAAYKSALSHFGLPKAKWDSSLERMYPGADKLLVALSGKYSLAVVANQNPGVSERLKSFGIFDQFKFVVSSAEFGVSKPEPEIFYEALRLAGCRPDEAVMIGDRLDNDILPAQQLGMKSIWVRQGYGAYGNVELLPTMPDLILNDVLELEQLL